MARNKKTSKSRRSYTDQLVKAAAHPTRQIILKSLKNKALSTVELEELTGENRYNLYHHLAQLQDAGLVDFRMKEGRIKRYYLKKEKGKGESFFQLDRDDLEKPEIFDNVLEVLSDAFGESIPDSEEIQNITFMLRYKDEEKGK
jgi:DNA-binding transcriptional ArsR family regulator